MASYVQAYFQASSMPKRLLQYALSRLEILDTNALGLDNVDIALGKNTVLEFRDVGLRLKVACLFLGFTCSILLTLCLRAETGNVTSTTSLSRTYQSPHPTSAYLRSSRCLQQSNIGRSRGSGKPVVCKVQVGAAYFYEP